MVGLDGLCEAANLARSVETALDQVRHLSKAVYHTLEQGKGARTEEGTSFCTKYENVIIN